MFRELARKKQALAPAQCIEILKTEPRGVLSVIGDDGYPYGVPMNFWYCEEDGKIYFHSGKLGHKIDALKACDKVSFCVYDKGWQEENDWALHIQSVIVFGKVELVADREKTVAVSRKLSLKYTPDEAYIDAEIAAYADATLVFALNPEHMTGKTVYEK